MEPLDWVSENQPGGGSLIARDCNLTQRLFAKKRKDKHNSTTAAKSHP